MEEVEVIGVTETGINGGEINKVNAISADLQDMYKVVFDKIRFSISNHEITPDTFQTILVKIVETVEELSQHQVTKLSGTEKRGIAINLTRMVIDELHKSGQINDEIYGWMTGALSFLAPLVFQAAKAIWSKLQDVHSDIQEHGTTGCCGRNFLGVKSSSKNVKRS